MRVLVTGGAGFIGSHLVDALLESGNEVVVLDRLMAGNKLSKAARKVATFINGDVRDPEIVYSAARGCRRIFHLAAVVGVDVVVRNPILTLETESLGIRNICAAAMAHGAERIVYSSSSSVYGDMDPHAPQQAEHVPYVTAKLSAESYLYEFSRLHGIEAAVIRYFNVYGQKQDDRMVIPRFLKEALAGRALKIHGDGKQTRDFTYFADAVRATVAIGAGRCDCRRGWIDIATGVETSIETLARQVLKVTRSASKVCSIVPVTARECYEVRMRRGIPDELARLLHPDKLTLLCEGLSETAETMDQNLS